MNEESVYNRLLAFLDELDERKIWYRLFHDRPESVAVLIATPGNYWEVEYMSDGSVLVECFRSTAELRGEEAIAEIFDQMAD